jgi:hypothetical protein
MNADLKNIDPRLSRLSRYILVGAGLIILTLTINKGCEYLPESTFRLASESRLPKWLKIPPKLTRADVSITMSYYNVLWGGRAVFVLQDKKGKTFEKVYGKETCGGPFQLKNRPEGLPSGYPGYEVVSVNGITEIFEQRKPEDILYVTDEPAVWNEYRAKGCG